MKDSKATEVDEDAGVVVDEEEASPTVEDARKLSYFRTVNAGGTTLHRDTSTAGGPSSAFTSGTDFATLIGGRREAA